MLFSCVAGPSGRTAFLYFLLFLGVLGGLSPVSAATGPGRKPQPRIRVRPIADKVYVHTTYHTYPGNKDLVPANGLIISTTKGAILVDTGWDSDQTLQILRWVADSLHQRVRMAVITHAHEDRLGGIPALRANHIKVISSPVTTQRAMARQLDAPTAALKPYTLIKAGSTRLELFYPGPGHSPDNLVAWLPRQRVLFGGCLVKEMAAPTPGNVDDADLKKWPGAVRTVAVRYPKAAVVVPGHGAWGGLELLNHTLEILRAPGRQPQTALSK
jgi:metallo-beta-lactamase class B